MSKREKIIKILQESVSFNDYYCGLVADQILALDDWIRVEDRLPEERCLVYTQSDDLAMRYRIIPRGLCEQVATDATHWMPLPEPPKWLISQVLENEG